MLSKNKNFHGLSITIENPAGTARMGQGDTVWRTSMRSNYGFIDGTIGVDGDPIDVFIPAGVIPSSSVVVVHQKNPSTGEYNEDKVMCGYATTEEALAEYRKHYDNPETFEGPSTEWTADELVNVLIASKGKPGMLDAKAKNKWLTSKDADIPREKLSSLYVYLGLRCRSNVKR